GSGARARRLRDRRAAVRCAGQTSGAGDRPASDRQFARRAQLAERRRGLRRAPGARGRARRDRRRPAALFRPRPSSGAGRDHRWRAVRQRQQGDQSGGGGASAGQLRGHLLDRRRPTQGRRPRRRAALARSRAPRLSDRRGGRGLRPGAFRARAVHAKRRSGERRAPGRPRRAHAARRQPRRAPGAGVRVVRPVPRLRAAGRYVQAAGRRAPARPARSGCRIVIAFSRTERGLLARWWWTVDHSMLAGLGLLALCGFVFVLASSPAVASRLGLPSLHFALRHFAFLLPAAFLLLGCSLLSPTGVRRLATGLLGATLVMLVLTLLIGPEIKGATRWLPIGGMLMQPSEFVKPALVVVVAALLARAPGLANA